MDAAGVWAERSHTVTQIQVVGLTMMGVIAAKTHHNRTLAAQIEAVPLSTDVDADVDADIAAVKAIVWSFP